jgi:hypothetical protein
MDVIDEGEYSFVSGLYTLNALPAMEVTSVLRHTLERDWSSDAVNMNTRANEVSNWWLLSICVCLLY